ncbi:hypothetical protein NUW54_g3356 [Trametes sanguinea]|uniref:Uncharacterized protein n=1 Tax=Trametes sanguinea TaxID=158606 RepID=A0ACC1Q2W0_9APHY|nr:hypothetical protein NUW54_g3356 [Trametes sanguinea]
MLPVLPLLQSLLRRLARSYPLIQNSIISSAARHSPHPVSDDAFPSSGKPVPSRRPLEIIARHLLLTVPSPAPPRTLPPASLRRATTPPAPIMPMPIMLTTFTFCHHMPPPSDHTGPGGLIAIITPPRLPRPVSALAAKLRLIASLHVHTCDLSAPSTHGLCIFHPQRLPPFTRPTFSANAQEDMLELIALLDTSVAPKPRHASPPLLEDGTCVPVSSVRTDKRAHPHRLVAHLRTCTHTIASWVHDPSQMPRALHRLGDYVLERTTA